MAQKPKFTVIEGGLAQLEQALAEFETASLNFEFITPPDDEFRVSITNISQDTEDEFLAATAPSETDTFIFKVGPFLVDLSD